MPPRPGRTRPRSGPPAADSGPSRSCACLTSSTSRASVPSGPTAMTSTTRSPSRLSVPPRIRAPGSLSTGRLSPVSTCSSTRAAFACHPAVGGKPLARQDPQPVADARLARAGRTLLVRVRARAGGRWRAAAWRGHRAPRSPSAGRSPRASGPASSSPGSRSRPRSRSDRRPGAPRGTTRRTRRPRPARAGRRSTGCPARRFSPGVGRQRKAQQDRTGNEKSRTT